jgi:ABC-2 type transport system permease protein
MWLRFIARVARAQLQMSRRNIEDLLPVLSIPFATVITMAILVNGGRSDLASYAVVAVVLMTLSQMGFFVGTEIIAQDRHNQVLELIVASPASYFALLGTRVFILTAFGMIGFAESWMIAWVVFGLRIAVHHPLLLLTTLFVTTFAVAATATIFAPLCSFGRTPRTIQNAIGGPLFLLGGVLVPVAYLPEFVQPVSRVIFLYWSADLLRDAFQPAYPANVFFRITAIAGLGVIAGAVGFALLQKLLTHLRREGTLGLA